MSNLKETFEYEFKTSSNIERNNTLNFDNYLSKLKFNDPDWCCYVSNFIENSKKELVDRPNNLKKMLNIQSVFFRFCFKHPGKKGFTKIKKFRKFSVFFLKKLFNYGYQLYKNKSIIYEPFKGTYRFDPILITNNQFNDFCIVVRKIYEFLNQINYILDVDENLIMNTNIIKINQQILINSYTLGYEYNKNFKNIYKSLYYKDKLLENDFIKDLTKQLKDNNLGYYCVINRYCLFTDSKNKIPEDFEYYFEKSHKEKGIEFRLGESMINNFNLNKKEEEITLDIFFKFIKKKKNKKNYDWEQMVEFCKEISTVQELFFKILDKVNNINYLTFELKVIMTDPATKREIFIPDIEIKILFAIIDFITIENFKIPYSFYQKDKKLNSFLSNKKFNKYTKICLDIEKQGPTYPIYFIMTFIEVYLNLSKSEVNKTFLRILKRLLESRIFLKRDQDLIISKRGLGLGYLLPIYCLAISHIIDELDFKYKFFYVDDINLLKKGDFLVEDYSDLISHFQDYGLSIKRSKILIMMEDEPGIFCERYYGSNKKKFNNTIWSTGLNYIFSNDIFAVRNNLANKLDNELIYTNFDVKSSWLSLMIYINYLLFWRVNLFEEDLKINTICFGLDNNQGILDLNLYTDSLYIIYNFIRYNQDYKKLKNFCYYKKIKERQDDKKNIQSLFVYDHKALSERINDETFNINKKIENFFNNLTRNNFVRKNTFRYFVKIFDFFNTIRYDKIKLNDENYLMIYEYLIKNGISFIPLIKHLITKDIYKLDDYVLKHNTIYNIKKRVEKPNLNYQIELLKITLDYFKIENNIVKTNNKIIDGQFLFPYNKVYKFSDLIYHKKQINKPKEFLLFGSHEIIEPYIQTLYKVFILDIKEPFKLLFETQIKEKLNILGLIIEHNKKVFELTKNEYFYFQKKINSTVQRMKDFFKEFKNQDLREVRFENKEIDEISYIIFKLDIQDPVVLDRRLLVLSEEKKDIIMSNINEIKIKNFTTEYERTTYDFNDDTEIQDETEKDSVLDHKELLKDSIILENEKDFVDENFKPLLKLENKDFEEFEKEQILIKEKELEEKLKLEEIMKQIEEKVVDFESDDVKNNTEIDCDLVINFLMKEYNINKEDAISTFKDDYACIKLKYSSLEELQEESKRKSSESQSEQSDEDEFINEESEKSEEFFGDVDEF